MSELDEAFRNPYKSGGKMVNRDLYTLYRHHAVTIAQDKNLDESQLIEMLRSMRDYLQFLNDLNNRIVQEISDVSAQLEKEED